MVLPRVSKKAETNKKNAGKNRHMKLKGCFWV